jgi:16S rRNA (guanine966-N2)-methyltransferase
MNPPRKSNLLRIIGGQWRGRKLPFPDAPGLRPTPDRVRETLFNWLQNHVAGACCLDLYAGSGALGWEALSRGAASVVFVDTHRSVVTQLRADAELLKTADAKIVADNAAHFLANNTHRFDIVFLDPPFDSNELQPACQALEQHGRLADPAYIYIESANAQSAPRLPDTWTVVRERSAGDVRYQLAISSKKPESSL